MPPRTRRNPAHPKPSSPYYHFGYQRPNYAFNWYGGSGGIPHNSRASGTRGLSGLGCGPCGTGNADMLESDRDEAIAYPAFKRTAIHQGALGTELPEWVILSPPSTPPPKGAVVRIPSSSRWQGPSPLRQPWPMSGFIGNVVGGLSSATMQVGTALVDGVKGVVRKIGGTSSRRPKVAAVGDWPLVIPEGPEPLVYPGEMGAVPIIDDIANALRPTFGTATTPIVYGGLAVGAYFLYKRFSKKPRANPSRRRRRRRRR